MRYFREIPTTLYPNLTSNDTNNYVSLTNILTRSAFLREIVENSAIFYEYQVKDGETPEMIAFKLYCDVERFWIVLLFNQLINPYYDFPLTQDQLESLIWTKYELTPEQALTTVHHYERRVRKAVLLNGIEQSSNTDVVTISEYEEDPTTGIATLNPYLPGTPDTTVTYATETDIIDSSTSIAKTFSVASVSVYAHEHELNEQRRTIKLLDTRYVAQVEQELKRLMTNG